MHCYRFGTNYRYISTIQNRVNSLTRPSVQT